MSFEGTEIASALMSYTAQDQASFSVFGVNPEDTVETAAPPANQPQPFSLDTHQDIVVAGLPVDASLPNEVATEAQNVHPTAPRQTAVPSEVNADPVTPQLELPQAATAAPPAEPRLPEAVTSDSSSAAATQSMDVTVPTVDASADVASTTLETIADRGNIIRIVDDQAEEAEESEQAAAFRQLFTKLRKGERFGA